MSSQHIGFMLGGEEYAIPILAVQEIIKPVPATRIPESPEHVLGIINLRGKVIPVIELKKRLGIESGGNGEQEQKIIVVNIGRMTIGGVVDSITGVVNLEEKDVRENVGVISKTSGDYIRGVATLEEDRLLQLIDFSRLLSVGDMTLLEDNIVKTERTEEGRIVVTRKVSGMGGEYLKKEVREEIIDRAESKGLEREVVQQIMADIQEFLDALSSGDLDSAEAILAEISVVGEKELFTEIGKITRNLHNALTEFKTLIDPRLKNMALEEMPEATDKLQWVISRTEEAAEKTINLMEKNLSLQSEIIKRLDLIDRRLKGLRKADKEREAMGFLRQSLERMNGDFMEVLLAQEFQDLTGQIIKKVIALVAELESQLVRLVKVFGVKIESKKVEEQLAGPRTRESEDALSSQEDVDALLKEFGF